MSVKNNTMPGHRSMNGCWNRPGRWVSTAAPHFARLPGLAGTEKCAKRLFSSWPASWRSRSSSSWMRRLLTGCWRGCRAKKRMCFTCVTKCNQGSVEKRILTEGTMGKFALLRSLLFVMAGASLPSFAFAHTGAGHAGIGESGGFMLGLIHPAGGLDHVCAMLAVGLWAAQMGGRSVWAVPLTFVSVMALGGALPMSGIGLPFAEQGIVLSVLMPGVLIAASVRLPLWLSTGIVGLFALCHGHAHGAEMPALSSGMAYALGFMLATAVLHIIGIAFGLGMKNLARERVVHFAGAGVALCGVYLAVA